MNKNKWYDVEMDVTLRIQAKRDIPIKKIMDEIDLSVNSCTKGAEVLSFEIFDWRSKDDEE